MEHAQAHGISGSGRIAGSTSALDRKFFILDIGQVGRGDLYRAGGKAANLGELVRGGFPVPAGFVVTTAACDFFVAHNQLGETVARALGNEREGGATIRAAFEAAPMPTDIEQDILLASDRLGAGAVAVRSSATAEDLPEAAFAGQQDTFLNVLGGEALLDSVRRCWASLWTDRAIAYRARLGVDHGTVKLAVIVQRMVAAECAGVLFTANPVTGARREIVIDANPGLGEAVVSGLVTPDHFVLRKRWWGWRIADRRAGKRELVIRARPGGGTEHVTGPAVTGEPLPPDRALRRLASLGTAIERHFGSAQDIEWASAGRDIFILQARPITALPEPLPQPGRAQRLMAGLIAELLPDRPYPLEFTTWVPAVYGFLTRFADVLGLRGLPLERLFVVEDDVVIRLRGVVPFRPRARALLAPFRVLQLARQQDPTSGSVELILDEAESRVRALETRDLTALSWPKLLATVHEALAIPALIWDLRVRYLLGPMLAVARVRLVLALLRRGDLFGRLVFTGIETRTLEMNRMLEALAERIRFDPTLSDVFARYVAGELWTQLELQSQGRAFLAELRSFLGRYGHREAGGTMQLSRATWKDAPDVVLGMLQALARTEPRRQLQRPAEKLLPDELLRHPLLRIPLLRSRFVALLRDARRFPQLREDTRFYFMLPVPVLRRTLLELGRRLAEARVLDDTADVFHLQLHELERIDGEWPPAPALATELRNAVARRRGKRAALEGTPLVDPRLFGRLDPGGDALLRGVPGSPGIAEGPVCVVHDSVEFGRFRAGDVLVAPYTNPAWTPLFERAAAVVVDCGGPASHAAIVAREYGIPAVMATVVGTRQLADGERVRVDGAAGLVFRADSAGER